MANAVLEEFTGVNCGYCPEGHVIANDLYSNNPGRVVLINIHAGAFADPSAGQPDFRTAYGEAFANEFGVTGYPSGVVQRNNFGSGVAMNRGEWTAAAEEVFTWSSPMNVGFTSSFDAGTRELTVNVELYYTGTVDVSSNFIHVAFLENGYIGYQSDYGNGSQQNYTHNHILREMMTGQWGDEVTTVTPGTLVERTYTYTVPAEYEISGAEVAVFVTEDKLQTYTGGIAEVGNTYDGATALNIGEINNGGNSTASSDASTLNTFTVDAVTNLAGTEDMLFTLTGSAPSDWSASFTDGSNVYTTDATIAMSSGVNQSIEIGVLTGATPGIGVYTLTMSSVNNPTASTVVEQVYVISGVTDLVISSTNSYGDGSDNDATTFEDKYEAGLTLAGNTGIGVTTDLVANALARENNLSDVNNIYFNVGWTFPGLTDDMVDLLKDFMDNGGNVLAAGQDLGWDTFEGSGSAADQNFFTNYFSTTYSADGSGSNSAFTAESSDLVFGGVSSSNIIDFYGSNYLYPDELGTTGNGQACFYYNGGSKIGGVRAENTNYKTVYLGIGIEMLEDANVASQIVKLSHDWFYGLVSVEEFDAAMQALGSAYPNPTNGIVNLPVLSADALENASMNVYDATGRLMKTVGIYEGQVLSVDLSDLEAGNYRVAVVNENGLVAQQSVQLVK